MSEPDRSSSSAATAEPALVDRLRAAGCVFAEDEARLLIAAATSPTELAAMVDRRVGGLPLEHVLGWTEFCGLRIAVDPEVFVPRRRTEFLAHEAAGLVPRSARPVVVDLCCGSGAVGAALAATLGTVELHAVDVHPAAVQCARRNIEFAAGRVHQGDLYEPLPDTLRGRVDLLVANAPYVPSGSIAMMPPEARLHEPRVALDGGPDGLDIVRRVAEGARDWLAPTGHVLVETSELQAPLVTDLFEKAGLVAAVARSGEADATVVVGSAGPAVS